MRSWPGQNFDTRWTIASLLEETSRSHSDRVAIVGDAFGTVTHGQIRDAGARLRAELRATIGPRRVAVACLAGLDLSWYVAIHAIFGSEFIYAALEPEAPDARNAECLDACAAEAVVADRRFLDRARRIAGPSRAVLCIDDAIESRVAGAGVSVPEPNEPAALIFTSGSTGRPKAVVRSHRSLAHAMYCFAANYAYSIEDVNLYPGSPGHIGSLNDALCCMVTGYASIPVDIADIDLERVRRRLREDRVTAMPMSPSLLRLLLRDLKGDLDAPALRLVWGSGEPLLRSDLELFFKVFPTGRCRIAQNYGSTETGPMYSGFYRREHVAGEGPLPLDRPHRDTSIVVESESGAPAQPGEIGAIVVRSEYLADGYLAADRDEQGKFGIDGHGRYFRIGDRGWFDGRGALFVAGRADRQIKLHGRRIELGDVESAILSSGGHGEAAVVKVERERGGPMLVGVLGGASTRRDAGEGLADGAASALRERLERCLPAAAVPHRFLNVPSLPRTVTGKVDYAAVQRLASSSVRADVLGTGGPPIGIVESWIADCWQFVLDIPRPGRDESFLSLGGDSLAAIELALLLERRFGLRLSLDAIVQHPTIAEQAQAIELGTEREFHPLVRLKSDDRGPVCLLIPGLGGHAWVFAELARMTTAACEIRSLSLGDVLALAGDETGPVALAALIGSALGDVADRPLLIGGYSFGAIVALHVVASWARSPLRPSGLLLLDPAPSPFAPTAHRLGLSVLRLVRSRSRPDRNRATSMAGSELAEQIATTSRWLQRRFLPPPKSVPPIPTRMVLSRGGTRLLRGKLRIAGLAAAELRPELMDVEHLDVLRLPHVGRTAAWLDRSVDELVGEARERSDVG